MCYGIRASLLNLLLQNLLSYPIFFHIHSNVSSNIVKIGHNARVSTITHDSIEKTISMKKLMFSWWSSPYDYHTKQTQTTPLGMHSSWRCSMAMVLLAMWTDHWFLMIQSLFYRNSWYSVGSSLRFCWGFFHWWPLVSLASRFGILYNVSTPCIPSP